MGSMMLIVSMCLILPMALLSALLEKKSRTIAWFLIFGCLMCFAAYWVNQTILIRTDCTRTYLQTTLAPIFEETLKLIPVILYALFVSKERKNLLSIAFAVGIGFSMVENTYVLLSDLNTASVAWMAARCVGTGLMHGMSTCILGLSVFYALRDKRVAFVGTISGWFMAIMYHGVYNCLVNYEPLQGIGLLLPLFTYVAIFIAYQKDALRNFLYEMPQ